MRTFLFSFAIERSFEKGSRGAFVRKPVTSDESSAVNCPNLFKDFSKTFHCDFPRTPSCTMLLSMQSTAAEMNHGSGGDCVIIDIEWLGGQEREAPIGGKRR